MPLFKSRFVKPDGRYLIHFAAQKVNFNSFEPSAEHQILRPASWIAPDLRYNAMRNEWQSYATSRQDRPFLPPPTFCPLCVSKPQEKGNHLIESAEISTEFPSNFPYFDIAVVENLFPALSPLGETGNCEIVVYTPKHAEIFSDMSLDQLQRLVEVWQDRSLELGSLPDIEQVFIFENRGEFVGVTLHHPHGQIYAYTHTPPHIFVEHQAAKHHYEKTSTCLICTLTEHERSQGTRVILETENVISFVPYAAKFPYEVHVTSKRHAPRIEHLNLAEIQELAQHLKSLTTKYDLLFSKPMPYIMSHHQSSSKVSQDPTYHWHIEFYPFLRTADKHKYLAGSETGAGFFVNDTFPELKAQELRSINLK